MAIRPLLYYITDRSQFTGDESARRHALLQKIAEAARCGVHYIQLREKDLSARQLQKLALEVLDVIRRENAASREKNSATTRLLINSRIDIALAVDADGVHLRSDDVSPTETRQIMQKVFTRNSESQTRNLLTQNSKTETRNFVVALSCHSEEDVIKAAKQRADFAVFAPVFEKRGVPHAPTAGLDQFRRVCAHDVPVFALGGVTLENAYSCFAAGAAGIAAIRLFQQHSIADIVKSLLGD
jgi:thiamine-phosphate pyrophosphorylase